MYNLTYKMVSVDQFSGRYSVLGQLGTIEKTNLIACLAQTGATHIQFASMGDSQAEYIARGHTPTPKTIDAETQEWYDIIHAQPNVYGSSVFGGYLKVWDRTIFAATQLILDFPADTGTSIGTAASAATDGTSTWCGRYYNYLYNRVGVSRFQTGDMLCGAPEITGDQRVNAPFNPSAWATNAEAQTYSAETKKIADTWAASGGKTAICVANPNFTEVSSGSWAGYTQQNNFVCSDYYGAWNGISKTTPAGYIADWSSIYSGTSLDGYGISTAGIPQIWGEWGDLAYGLVQQGQSVRSGDNFISGTSIESWLFALINVYKGFRDGLINPGKMVGFCYWGGWHNQNTSIVRKTGSGDSSEYFLNSRGQILAAFFKGKGIGRVPINTDPAATYSVADPSFGGRNMHH